MRIYIGLTLSECICIISGFGAYPKSFKSRPGAGPTAIKLLLQPFSENDVDFETILNLDSQAIESSLTLREALRSYQMCLQYWLATLVHQRVPIKQLRYFATFLVSAFWQGRYAGYFLSILGIPLYLPVESLWQKMVDKKSKGMKKSVIEGLLWGSKTFISSYLGMALLMMTSDKIWNYYRSVYYLGHAWGVALYLVGMLLRVQGKTEEKKRERRSITPRVVRNEEVKDEIRSQGMREGSTVPYTPKVQFMIPEKEEVPVYQKTDLEQSMDF